MRHFFQVSPAAFSLLVGVTFSLASQVSFAQDPTFGSTRFGERFVTGMGGQPFDAAATDKHTYFMRMGAGFSWFQGQGADIFFNLGTDVSLSFGYYWEALGLESDLRWQAFTGSGDGSFPTDAPWNHLSLMAGPSYMLVNIRSLSLSTHALAGGLVAYSSDPEYPQVYGTSTGGPAVQVGANLFFNGPNLRALGNPYARGYQPMELDGYFWTQPLSFSLRYDMTYVLGNNLFDMLVHSVTLVFTIRDTRWKLR